MNDDEKRGYSKGYAAGQRKAGQTARREQYAAVREDFIQRMMISIAPQIISEPWGRKIDGKWVNDRGAKEIMATVRSVAEEAAKNCNFYLPPQEDVA